MYDLGDQEGVLSTTTLLRFLNMEQRSCPATLASICLKIIQQEAGISTPILEYTELLSYLEPGWIPRIHDFLHQVGATITNATEKPTLNRENDSFPMDHFTNANLTPKELAKLNRVRLHLQIARISEIATADGKHIHKSWLTETGECNSLSLLNWPRQEINPSL